MPFLPQRLIGLRKAKGIRTQEELEAICGISRPVLHRNEKGTKVPTSEALETLATNLDAEMGYFHGLGDYYDDTEDGFARAAAQMSFAVFNRDLAFSSEQKVQCQRVLTHNAAPRTAAAWRDLAEMIRLAIGPTGSSTSFDVVEGGKQ
jgi:transcriptional regulator with XRE-family HTH domain